MQYLTAFTIFVTSLSASLWHSSKQLQRLLLNQGGLHDHLYIALNPDTAVLRAYNLSCELAGKYHQPPLLWSCCIHSR